MEVFFKFPTGVQAIFIHNDKIFRGHILSRKYEDSESDTEGIVTYTIAKEHPDFESGERMFDIPQNKVFYTFDELTEDLERLLEEQKTELLKNIEERRIELNGKS